MVVFVVYSLAGATDGAWQATHRSVPLELRENSPSVTRGSGVFEEALDRRGL